MTSTILTIKTTLLEYVSQEDVKGCTQDELKHICKKQNIDTKKLPQLYQEFMMEMGKQAGKLFWGSEIYYSAHESSNLKSEANELLEANGLDSLPQDAFVYFAHQTYTFGFFRTNTIQVDPDIYAYTECNEGIKRIGKFSILLEQELNLMIKVIEDDTK